jgi:hypothetical protein
MKEALSSSKASVLTRATRRNTQKTPFFICNIDRNLSGSVQVLPFSYGIVWLHGRGGSIRVPTYVESEGFWRRCIPLRITEVLDFFHRSVLKHYCLSVSVKFGTRFWVRVT